MKDADDSKNNRVVHAIGIYLEAFQTRTDEGDIFVPSPRPTLERSISQ